MASTESTFIDVKFDNGAKRPIDVDFDNWITFRDGNLRIEFWRIVGTNSDEVNIGARAYYLRGMWEDLSHWRDFNALDDAVEAAEWAASILGCEHDSGAVGGIERLIWGTIAR